MTSERIVESDKTCPRCGTSLLEKQLGVETAEANGVIQWQAVSRWCRRMCPYTAAELREKDT